jgi:hypothetical protein
MAILIDVPGKKDGKSRIIGVGLSPGDENYPEPY